MKYGLKFWSDFLKSYSFQMSDLSFSKPMGLESSHECSSQSYSTILLFVHNHANQVQSYFCHLRHKKPSALFHVTECSLMCSAAFLFLPSDILHFNSPHAQLMYVNNRLMHAETASQVRGTKKRAFL